MQIKFFLFLFYLFPIAIASNIITGNFIGNKRSYDYAYKKLFELNYYSEDRNPYEEFKTLKLHPTSIFSLPLYETERKRIENKTVTLNKFGFRNNPFIPKSKSNGKKCILFTGSSAAFGVGASYDENTIAAILNKKIGNDYSVYNLAIPSWNSRQELTAIINFMSTREYSRCMSTDIISFTGTTDIESIYKSSKTKLFIYPESKQELISSSEHFGTLLRNTELGLRSQNNLKYNFKQIFIKINKRLFGNLLIIFRNSFEKFQKNNFSKEEIIASSIDEEFIGQQIDSFIVNQKIINNLITSLKGNHLVVIQPDRGNSNNKPKWWLHANEVLTNKLTKEDCLDFLDLRIGLIEEQIKNNNYNEHSLFDMVSNKNLKIKNHSKTLFFDNSHLTNFGNEIVASKILDIYKTKSLRKICEIKN